MDDAQKKRAAALERSARNTYANGTVEKLDFEKAMLRIIEGYARQREFAVEELGLTFKTTDEALKEHARSLGKSPADLTADERVQAYTQGLLRVKK